MQRERIDRAVHAQLDRLTYLLRDMERSGGRDTWSHLFSHGHKFPTVMSAVRKGYLKNDVGYNYEITESGRQYIESLDRAVALSA